MNLTSRPCTCRIPSLPCQTSHSSLVHPHLCLASASNESRMPISPPSPSSSRSSSPAGSDASEERASKKRKVEFEQAQLIAGPALEAAQYVRLDRQKSSSRWYWATGTLTLCPLFRHSLDFVPPKGLVKASVDEPLSEFSYEQVKQKLRNGQELWAIRLPAGVGAQSM